MGVWLHTERIGSRAGKLTQAKEEQLNSVTPGWRQGRPRWGANSTGLPGSLPRPARNSNHITDIQLSTLP